MDLKIQNKIALVTGAVGGIGEATLEQLKDAGCQLIISDYHKEKTEELAERLGGTPLVADLGSVEGCDRFKKDLEATGLVPDIVVHTTGITGEKGDPLEISEQGWDDAIQLDFMSGVRVAERTVPAMAEKGWGRVIFITSENVVQPYVDEACYNSSKAALLCFAKSLSIPYGKKGVLVNCVSPAFIETDMTDGMMDMRMQKLGVSKEEAVKSFLKEERPFIVPERRGRPEEVAAVIAFLVSDLSTYVIGSNYRVDGGAVLAINT